MRLFFIFFLLTIFLPAQSQPNCPQLGTYFGQTQHDDFKGICSDHNGNIYAIGNTYNNNLPVTPGAFQSVYKNDYEAFLVKFDSCGNLVWCTYFGSNGFDSGEKIVFSENDSTIVFTGYTNGADIPTTPSCFQPASNGNYECFLAKMNLNGQPEWISYFGASNADFAYTLTTDQDGNLIIGGTTTSSGIHTTSSSFQQTNNGATDAFLAKFNKQGVFLFSTLFGGLNAEDIHCVTTDSDKNIIAVGGSFSNNLNTSTGCLQSGSNGGMESYILKLDQLGNRLFSTYAGGSGTDDSYGVSVDANKDIYISGHTSSGDFYMTSVSHQTLIAGNNDNYCMKLSSQGTLLWSTVFGGSSFDNNVSSQLNGNNELINLSNTQSTDFPVLGAGSNSIHAGAADMVLTRISAQGQILWSGFSGGSGGETAGELILKNNKVIIAGGTSSADLPVISGNFQVTNNGQSDGFILSVDVPGSSVLGLSHFQDQPCMLSFTEKFFYAYPCNVTHLQVFDALGKELFFSNTEVFSLERLEMNQIYFIRAFENQRLLGSIKYVRTY